MHRLRLVLAMCLGGVSALGQTNPHQEQSVMPPTTPKHEATDRHFGVVVHDPYRWLEDAQSPAVTQWIAAQNTHTEAVMSGFTDAKAIAKRVGELSLTSTQQFAPEIVANTLFYLRQTPPQPQAVLVAQAWPEGAAKVLVDPNTDEGSLAITHFWPSPDGKTMAWGSAEGDDEATTIHFVEVASGKALPDALPHAGGGTTASALVWDADGQGVTYARLPLPGSVAQDQLQFYAALYHHLLGTPAAQDALVFGKGLSKVAEYSLLASADGQHAAALMHEGDGSPCAVYLRSGSGAWKLALAAEANVRARAGQSAAWDGDRLLVIAHQGAPRGKLLALDANGKRSEVLAQGEWAMQAVAPIQGGFLLTQVRGPDWRVQQYTRSGALVRDLPLPQTGIGIGHIASSASSSRALITYSGWTIPSRWAEYDGANGALNTVFEVKPAADYSQVTVHSLSATSRDGTQVPVTVIALKGVDPNGKRPAILNAYGGFGIPVAPRFIGANLAWLERGGVYAVANIRGGSEFGEDWHAGGALGHKQNVFDDFHAAAQALVAQRWTSRDHLGIIGGSNGGLLMGAQITQHPGDYRAVVAQVGLYDMLRVELWPNGQYNASEFGTVTNKPDFEWLHAYSPLHHVEPGTAYPAVLLTTGVNDPRVAPWQSRKFAAALQAANRSPRPVLLLTRMNEGHGVTATFSQKVGNAAAALAFFAQELGATPAHKPAQ